MAQFFKTANPEDEFFLIDFNTRARLLLDRTRDGDAVLKKFNYVEPNGNTAFYDAVYLGIEKVTRGSRARKIVLVISDGEDNESRYTFKELQRRVRETDVIIYAVGFGGSMLWFGSSAGVAITNIFPDAKSVWKWVTQGWFVIAAYIVGFAALYLLLGWHPHAPHS